MDFKGVSTETVFNVKNQGVLTAVFNLLYIGFMFNLEGPSCFALILSLHRRLKNLTRQVKLVISGKCHFLTGGGGLPKIEGSDTFLDQKIFLN